MGLEEIFGGKKATSAGEKDIAGYGAVLGDILKGLFSGAMAEGGFVAPGKFALVGERGPEIAFGGRSG